MVNKAEKKGHRSFERIVSAKESRQNCQLTVRMLVCFLVNAYPRIGNRHIHLPPELSLDIAHQPIYRRRASHVALEGVDSYPILLGESSSDRTGVGDCVGDGDIGAGCGVVSTSSPADKGSMARRV